MSAPVKTWTVQAVLDMGLQVLGDEMERLQQEAAGTRLPKHRAQQLVTFIRAACYLSEDIRQGRGSKNLPPAATSEQLADQIVAALARDPAMRDRVLNGLARAGAAS